ncbi:Sideroflexin-5 [Chamberlinius hualienensis]
MLANQQFRLGQSRYDQVTFKGRFLHCLDLIDPSTLLVTKDRLSKAIQLLEDYKSNNLSSNVTDEELWKAQKIKQAIIHPDTEEKIFMPFRMSGFVPFGSPIVIGLLLPNPAIPHMIFWQWLNQSHNACVNYANRNATKPTSTSTIVQGYLGATGTAVSIALGLTMLIKKANQFKASTKLIITRFVPYPAVATASVLNVLLMRKHELKQGIEVVDKNENVVGTSQIAAKKALVQMAISRAVIAAPIFIIPPAVMTVLEKTRWLQRNPRLVLPLNAVLATLSFGFGLPLGIAVFPQRSEVKRCELESTLNTDEEILYYNKGL